MVVKGDFLKVVKFPQRKNCFLVILRSFFSTYKSFPERGYVVPTNTFEGDCFSEKKYSLAGPNKKII